MLNAETIRILAAQPWFAIAAGSLISAVLIMVLIFSWDAVVRRLKGRK
ncbi:MAG: hypothetical protein ACOWWM_17970 [Desulfobacterales bacterium]